jgi:predicted phosphodiesterase
MKMTKFVAAGDVHGDEQDKKSVQSLLSFMAHYKPSLVVMTGDLWDFRSLRRGASDDDQAESLERDWDAGEEFLKDFFAYGDERVFLRGNHDERLWDLANSVRSGLARDYAEQGIDRVEELLKKLNARMLPYDSVGGVYSKGSLKFVHGYGHSMHAAKQHADAYGNVLFGHTHAIDYFKSVSIDNREGFNIGALCNLEPSYNRHMTRRMRWQHGWAFGVIYEDGTHDVFQAKQRNGKFTIPTNVRTL